MIPFIPAFITHAITHAITNASTNLNLVCKHIPCSLLNAGRWPLHGHFPHRHVELLCILPIMPSIGCSSAKLKILQKHVLRTSMYVIHLMFVLIPLCPPLLFAMRLFLLVLFPGHVPSIEESPANNPYENCIPRPPRDIAEEIISTTCPSVGEWMLSHPRTISF